MTLPASQPVPLVPAAGYQLEHLERGDEVRVGGRWMRVTSAPPPQKGRHVVRAFWVGGADVDQEVSHARIAATRVAPGPGRVAGLGHEFWYETVAVITVRSHLVANGALQPDFGPLQSATGVRDWLARASLPLTVGGGLRLGGPHDFSSHRPWLYLPAGGGVHPLRRRLCDPALVAPKLHTAAALDGGLTLAGAALAGAGVGRFPDDVWLTVLARHLRLEERDRDTLGALEAGWLGQLDDLRAVVLDLR